MILEGFNISNAEYLGGSTGAYLYTDDNGAKWVLKKGANSKQLYSEYMANKVYSKFGINVPKAILAKDSDGDDILAMEYLEDSVPLGYTKDTLEELKDDVAKGFIIDVITANWDVVGTNLDLDNVRIHNGKAYRVDLGGALLTRALGADKPFGNIPSEHETLLNPNINKNTAYIFSVLDKVGIADTIREYFKDYLIDGVLNKEMFRNSIVLELKEVGGYAEQYRDVVVDALVERADYISKLFLSGNFS